jgi:soluble lytic murein transglycosylase
MLNNGDWDQAFSYFSTVINDPSADTDSLIAAQIGLAQAALKAGNFSEAARTLDAILSQFPAHPRTAQAYLLRGEARSGTGDWAGAISDYQSYIAIRPGLIDSYVYERLGDAYLATAQTDTAIASYLQALTSERYLAGEFALREKLARIYHSLGQIEDEIGQYRIILSKSQNIGYQASIDYKIGQIYFEVGQYEAAYQQFNHVFMTYPTRFEALSALRALLDAGYDVDQYQRGIVNFNQGQYDIAIEGFLNYWAAIPPSQYSPDSYIYVARSYRALGNPSAAITQLNVYIKNAGAEDGPDWGNAWLQLAGAYADKKDSATAFATYDTFVEQFPQDALAADALLEAGQLAETLGDTSKAASYYQRLAVEYPQDPRAADHIFSLALTDYQQSDYSTAETLFRGAAELASNERPAHSLLWLGKTLLAEGKNTEAQAALQQAVSIEPHGFFGIRASDLLDHKSPFSNSAALVIPSSTESEQSEAEQWLISQFKLTESPAMSGDIPLALASNPQFLRGKELWELGLVLDAKQELESIRQQYQDDPTVSYQLALFFRNIGLYRSSILAAARLHRLANIDPLDGPVFLARLHYPLYFSDLILERSKAYGLDPVMVLALIWQESLFEGFATSSASAQGLMQIWPPTGDDIAAALNWPDYHSSDLQRPYVSVAFGTWLLGDEMNRFDQDVFATLSAYNAGTGRAATWREQSNGDPDMFVETISLDEPKTYVERIYEHFHIYQELYSSP